MTVSISAATETTVAPGSWAFTADPSGTPVIPVAATGLRTVFRAVGCSRAVEIGWRAIGTSVPMEGEQSLDDAVRPR